MENKKLTLIKKLLDVARLRCKYSIANLYLFLTFAGRQHLILSFVIWTTIIYKLIKFSVRSWSRWDRLAVREDRYKGFYNNMYDQIKGLQKCFINYIAMQNKVSLNIYNFICNNLYSAYTQANTIRSKIMGYDFFISFSNLFIDNNIYLKFLFLIVLFLFIIFINKKK